MGLNPGATMQQWAARVMAASGVSSQADLNRKLLRQALLTTGPTC